MMGSIVSIGLIVSAAVLEAVWSVNNRGRRFTMTRNGGMKAFMSAHNISPAAFAIVYSVIPFGRSSTEMEDG